MTVLTIAVVGLIAALVMTGVLRLVSGPSEYLNPVHVIGSRRDADLSHSGVQGEVIHLFFGIVFAFFYWTLLALYGGELQPMWVVTACTAFGFSQGLFVGFIFGVVVVRWHPKRQVGRSLPALVVIYLFSHIVYGITVGAGFALTGVSFSSTLLGGS